MHQDTCPCGGKHRSDEHERFAEGMPTTPHALTDDFLRMGMVPDEVQTQAQAMTLQTLEQVVIAPQDAYQADLRRALVTLAGSEEQIWQAAFGEQAGAFKTDALKTEFGRREFLEKVGLAMALVSTGLTQLTAPVAAQAQPGKLEKSKLLVGFIPITCATPILMAKPLDFYSKYGLDVTLKKMPNWAAVRDAMIAGELDAAHMLAPMPLAISLGLGSAQVPVRLASIENINGQAITVALKHKDKIKGPADFKGFKLGVPFQYSMHNLLLRYYLAAGGLDPDKDVQIRIVPPPDSVAKMTVGELDAYLMPDPFNQRAVFEGVGYIHLLSKELWPGHPCCSFAAREDWITAHPNSFNAINKAIIDAALFAKNRVNRANIARAISEKGFLNQPVAVVEAVLTGKFDDGLGNKYDIPDRIDFDPYPWQSYSQWILSQLERWKLAKDVDYAKASQQVFLTDTARKLQQELKYASLKPPTQAAKVEKLKYDTFDPAKAKQYVPAQIKKFRV
ncbi:CmpA/NrtA family ABC transporter substrate-binding protein [Anthocerotibacter panamensis]|uniref:CmpA/NrtA family ABC transporter substrate-binding protein n=1 Tax=Anthocerotibacter panamensis TaxID=2857077 RepID=UPI001C40656F|nr:CmpA/NrtA family ABC transporter substrate-binding protein [Anthocerotibacter panamensis]